MNRKYLAIWALVLTYAFPGMAQSLSDEDKQMILSSQVSIIPDVEHGSKFALEREITRLRKIKSADASYDCVFLEIEPKAGKAIQAFLNGADYSKTVGVWIDKTSRQLKVSFVNIIPDWFLKEVSKLGYKILGADVDWSSELGKKTIPAVQAANNNTFSYYEQGHLLIGERSRVMAESIISALKNGVCKKAALVVGDGHLESFVYKPVQQYLKDAKLEVIFWH